MIDGCSKFQGFRCVILPLIMPGLAATAIYSFIQVWNEYMFSQTLIMTETRKTLTVGIAQMAGEYRTLWNDMMAASFLTCLPLVRRSPPWCDGGAHPQRRGVRADQEL